MILFHVKKSFVWRTFFYSSEFYHVTIIWYSIILIKFFAKHGRIHTWKSSWKWSHIELHLINPMRIILNSLQFFLLTNAEKNVGNYLCNCDSIQIVLSFMLAHKMLPCKREGIVTLISSTTFNLKAIVVKCRFCKLKGGRGKSGEDGK